MPFFRAVSATTTTPPVDPDWGVQYVVPAEADGDWSAHEGKIAIGNGSGGFFYVTLADGDLVFVAADDELFVIIDGEFEQLYPATGGGGGEANTAANVGTAGVGIFKTKSGVELRFKKINAGSAAVTITDDTGNDEIDIDVVDASTTQKGVVELATDGQTDSGVAVQGSDARLSDQRTPIDGSVTYAKIQNIAANSFLANISGSTGAVGAKAASDILTNATPASTAFCVGFDASGNIQKVLISDILKLAKGVSIDNLLFANIGTPSTGVAGKVEREDDDLWFYDNTRGKWLSMLHKITFQTAIASTGIVTVSYLLNGPAQTQHAPLVVPYKCCIVGYSGRILGGTLSNLDLIVRKNATTDILTVNRTASGSFSNFAQNITLASGDSIDVRLDPKSDSVNVPSLSLFLVREREA